MPHLIFSFTSTAAGIYSVTKIIFINNLIFLSKSYIFLISSPLSINLKNILYKSSLFILFLYEFLFASLSSFEVANFTIKFGSPENDIG